MSSIVRRSARKASRSAYQVLRRAESRLTSRRLILMYHRVDDAGPDPWDLAVHPDEFDRQIDSLTTLGEVLPLGDLLRQRPRRPGQSSFSITFDDGYLCNLTAALPILERHGAPATIFIPPALVGAPYFWWDRFAWTIMESQASPAELAEWWLRTRPDQSLGWGGSEQTRLELLGAMYRHLIRLPNEGIIEVLDAMTDSLNLPAFVPFARPVNREELARLAAHPLIEIGAHTNSHRALTTLDQEQCLAEMIVGNDDLDELVGSSDRILAYPYGRCNRDIAELAAQAGFQYAVTTAGGQMSRLDPPRLIPRTGVSSRPEDQTFHQWLAAA